MKLFYVFIVLILLAALAGPYFIQGPDGQPLMDAEELIPDLPAAPLTVYRWQDEWGVWQFGEQPPDGVAAEPMTVKAEAGMRLPKGWAGETAAPKDIKPVGTDLLQNLKNPVEAARAGAAAYEAAAERRAP